MLTVFLTPTLAIAFWTSRSDPNYRLNPYPKLSPTVTLTVYEGINQRTGHFEKILLRKFGVRIRVMVIVRVSRKPG